MEGRIFDFDVDRRWDYENGFYLTSHVTRMAKLLAHYELYKTISGLPGHVVECGVYKGASFLRFATFREILESPHSRKIVGFDAFGKFPDANAGAADREFIRQFAEEGGDGIDQASLEEALRLKALGNYELIQGDICITVPDYVAKRPELRIALLHVDVDVYQPSKVILEQLFDRVVPGGLVVLDDYGTVAGETQAVDEFLLDRPGRYRLEKLPISHIPAYIRK